MHWGSSCYHMESSAWKVAVQGTNLSKCWSSQRQHFCYNCIFFVSSSGTDPQDSFGDFEILWLVGRRHPALVDRGLLGIRGLSQLFGGPVVSLRGPVLSPVDRGNSGLASPPLPFSLLGGAGIIPGVTGYGRFSLFCFLSFFYNMHPPLCGGQLDTAFR